MIVVVIIGDCGKAVCGLQGTKIILIYFGILWRSCVSQTEDLPRPTENRDEAISLAAWKMGNNPDPGGERKSR